MRRIRVPVGIGAAFALAAMTPAFPAAADDPVLENGKLFENPTGKSSSFSPAGAIDLTGGFFQSLGTNGRTCETCHLPGDGWSVSARSARDIFKATGGLHPLFEFDGQNCPGADRSTLAARAAASSLMIRKALVRFSKSFPANGEIDLVAVEGNSCPGQVILAPQAPTGGGGTYLVYRRPLPTVNFGALGTVLWDGLGNDIAASPSAALPLIFVAATQLHAQTTSTPTQTQIDQGVAFMTTTTNAQIVDDEAGRLDRRGARGGAENLADEPFTGPPGFDIYNAWASQRGFEERERIARGQALFNSRTFQIRGMGGLPDRTGTCAGCHRVANQGNQSSFGTLNIGISDASRRTPDLPLYTLKNRLTNEKVKTTDAGRALLTGRWEDIGKFKVPMLRGLAARAPYFHNGSAADLEAVVEFYDDRFHIGLSREDKKNLAAFLRAL